MGKLDMKENDSFLFVGKMPSFKELLDEVLSLTQKDWLDYKKRKLAGGAAAENTDTIPLVYDLKHRINSRILHKDYERFSAYIDEVIGVVIEKIGEVEVQQAMLTNLRAGIVIPRHRDKGPLTEKTHRIHVPVITNTGCIFSVGDESRNLEAGHIWIIDNVNKYHSVENRGENDRVHLIIDAI
jgi:aspartyl/asparaginyl beta-hydroxylase (cupin superfamily)